MTLKVLRAGLDTVEVSFRGELSEETIAAFDEAKLRAQGADGPYPVSIGVVELMMMPSAFGRWRWHLRDPRFSIVAKPKAARGSVVLQARFSALGLTNEHPDMLWLLIRTLVESLGDVKELCVSRADVCADVQGWVPSEGEMKNVVCPASYRATHGTEAGAQTFVFGKKKLLRIYDKRAEIVVSKKYWLHNVWEICEGYEAESPVWRVEFQAPRETLKELGIHTTSQLLANPGALLDYGLTWANLRVPRADATKTRWEEDPRWTTLREAVFGGVPLQRRVRVPELMSLDKTKRRLVGLVATAGAYFESDDYWSVLQRLSYIVYAMIENEGIDLTELVEDKRRRILGGDI